jgi:multisubunit Na+/H+ antiporter MnhB subunit
MATKFMQDNRGNKSAIRLMSMFTLFVALSSVLLVIYWAHKPGGGFEAVPYQIVVILLILLLFAFAPKVAQKAVEAWLERSLPRDNQPRL